MECRRASRTAGSLAPTDLAHLRLVRLPSRKEQPSVGASRRPREHRARPVGIALAACQAACPRPTPEAAPVPRPPARRMRKVGAHTIAPGHGGQGGRRQRVARRSPPVTAVPACTARDVTLPTSPPRSTPGALATAYSPRLRERMGAVKAGRRGKKTHGTARAPAGAAASAAGRGGRRGRPLLGLPQGRDGDPPVHLVAAR
jgi:hypothetical protein